MALTTQEKMALLQDKLMKSQNFLDFTGLTYEEIITRVNEKISSNENFDNFRESSIAQIFLEIFTGTVDLVNYYLERRAEECYMDTAKLKSSVILLAKMLGYVITRPVPASTQIKMKIKGPLPSGVNEGDKIDLPLHLTFSYDNNPYILKDTFSYTLSANSTGSLNSSTYRAEVDVTPLLAQGEIKNKEIAGVTNQQLGQKFQLYKITDKTFSNIYSNEDYGFDGDYWSGGVFVPNEKDVTLISIGNSREDVEYFKIDRRSLLNWENITSYTSTSAASRICLIRTTPDEGIELVFGDDRYASIGAGSDEGNNIYIQYLSTVGSKANKIGVIGERIQTGESINTDKGIAVTGNIEFNFITNIKNGADLESLESIKYNSPGIYYSLDRCVTSNDYVNYLKSLTSPIDIKNAIAWGEQEEGQGIYQYFNVVLYSVLGSMYNLTSNPASLKSDSEITLEENYGTSATVTQNSYFDVITLPNPTERLSYQSMGNTSALDPNVYLVNNLLQERSQITVSNIYISPVIHTYYLKGTVNLRKLSDRENVRNNIKNNVYTFLDENADFYKNIYLSNLTQIIEEFKEVVYVNLEFEAFPSISGADLENAVIEIAGRNYNPPHEERTLYDMFYNSYYYYVNAFDGDKNVRSFYNVFVKGLYDQVIFYTPAVYKTQDWYDLVSLGWQALSNIIETNIINNNGDIVLTDTTNYIPLRNEIARINIDDTKLLLQYV